MNTTKQVSTKQILAAQYNPTLLRQIMLEGGSFSDAEEVSTNGFDAIEIRDLIRQASANGERPAQLILGQQELAAYREFLLEEYGDAPPSLHGGYFLGLHIIESEEISKIELSGTKSHDAWDQQHRPLWQDDDRPRPGGKAAA